MTLAACALYACGQLPHDTHAIDITLLTVDHGLFDHSSTYATQISSFWEGHGIKCVALRADPEMIKAGFGTEDGARRARYFELKTAANEHKLDLILLGHHAQDQAETMLMRLQSSAGVGGMRGIPPRREFFARPWLDVHPQLIKNAHQVMQLPVFFDPTNKDLRYVRNALRHRVHPMMCEVFDSNWVTRAARAARHLREDEIALRSLIVQLLDGHVHLDLNQGRIQLEWTEGLTLTREVISAALRHFYYLALTHLTPTQTDRRRIREQIPLLDEIWRGHTNQQRSLPLGLVAWGSRGSLEIGAPALYSDLPGQVELVLNTPAQEVVVVWGTWQLTLTPSTSATAQGAYLGSAKMPFSLRLPPRGARYQPHKSPGSKRVKRLWSDRKVSRLERERLPVLIDADEQVLWAPYCLPAGWLYDKTQTLSNFNDPTWHLTWTSVE